MRQIGEVEVDKDIFLDLLKKWINIFIKNTFQIKSIILQYLINFHNVKNVLKLPKNLFTFQVVNHHTFYCNSFFEYLKTSVIMFFVDL